jgi:hypothetical protein
MVAVIRERLGSPDASNDLNRLGQRRLPFRHRREAKAELGELCGVPTMAESEDDATAREVIKIRRQPCGENRGPVAGAKDDRAEANSRGLNGERGKMEPDLRRVSRVVAEEECVELQRVGETPRS